MSMRRKAQGVVPSYTCATCKFLYVDPRDTFLLAVARRMANNTFLPPLLCHPILHHGHLGCRCHCDVCLALHPKVRHTAATEREVRCKASGGIRKCVTLTCTQQARGLALERDMPTFNSPNWEAAPQTHLSLDVWDASGRVQSRIDLEGKSHVVLGRDASAVEVAVDNRGVSRTHAAIVHHRNGRVYLIDLKSTHGTKVDGEALEAYKPTRLKEGSKMQLGHAQTLYVVHLHGMRKPSSTHDAETKQKEVPHEPPKQMQTKPQDSNAGNKDAVVRCSHILVKHKDSRRPTSWKEQVVTRTKEEALRMVARMREDILVGHATFAELAKTESHCSSAKKGGDLGEFAKGSMQPQFEEQAFALAVGKISQPFLSDSGAHIILRTS